VEVVETQFTRRLQRAAAAHLSALEARALALLIQVGEVRRE
jgi:hypothetical protein